MRGDTGPRPAATSTPPTIGPTEVLAFLVVGPTNIKEVSAATALCQIFLVSPRAGLQAPFVSSGNLQIGPLGGNLLVILSSPQRESKGCF